MGDDIDVEDISMRNYADDLDIAPMELMIVVRAVMFLTLWLQSADWRPSHVLFHVGHTMAPLGPQSHRRVSPWHELQQPPRCLLPEVVAPIVRMTPHSSHVTAV